MEYSRLHHDMEAAIAASGRSCINFIDKTLPNRDTRGRSELHHTLKQFRYYSKERD